MGQQDEPVPGGVCAGMGQGLPAQGGHHPCAGGGKRRWERQR